MKGKILMKLFIVAANSLDVERMLLKALETMGFERDVGDLEIEDRVSEIYSVDLNVRQVNL